MSSREKNRTVETMKGPYDFNTNYQGSDDQPRGGFGGNSYPLSQQGARQLNSTFTEGFTSYAYGSDQRVTSNSNLSFQAARQNSAVRYQGQGSIQIPITGLRTNSNGSRMTRPVDFHHPVPRSTKHIPPLMGPLVNVRKRAPTTRDVYAGLGLAPCHAGYVNRAVVLKNRLTPSQVYRHITIPVLFAPYQIQPQLGQFSEQSTENFYQEPPQITAPSHQPRDTQYTDEARRQVLAEMTLSGLSIYENVQWNMSRSANTPANFPFDNVDPLELMKVLEFYITSIHNSSNFDQLSKEWRDAAQQSHTVGVPATDYISTDSDGFEVYTSQLEKTTTMPEVLLATETAVQDEQMRQLEVTAQNPTGRSKSGCNQYQSSQSQLADVRSRFANDADAERSHIPEHHSSDCGVEMSGQTLHNLHYPVLPTNPSFEDEYEQFSTPSTISPTGEVISVSTSGNSSKSILITETDKLCSSVKSEIDLAECVDMYINKAWPLRNIALSFHKRRETINELLYDITQFWTKRGIFGLGRQMDNVRDKIYQCFVGYLNEDNPKLQMIGEFFKGLASRTEVQIQMDLIFIYTRDLTNDQLRILESNYFDMVTNVMYWWPPFVSRQIVNIEFLPIGHYIKKNQMSHFAHYLSRQGERREKRSLEGSDMSLEATIERTFKCCPIDRVEWDHRCTEEFVEQAVLRINLSQLPQRAKDVLRGLYRFLVDVKSSVLDYDCYWFAQYGAEFSDGDRMAVWFGEVP